MKVSDLIEALQNVPREGNVVVFSNYSLECGNIKEICTEMKSFDFSDEENIVIVLMLDD
jgi:hypothetical protein